MPELFKSASWTDFEALDGDRLRGKKEAVIDVRNWMARFPWNEQGFVLCGEFGTGKTTLLAAMLNAIWKKRPHEAAWTSWMDPFSIARNGEKGWANMYKEAASYRLLVVDDIWHDDRFRTRHIERGALRWFLEDRKPDYPIILGVCHANKSEFQAVWGREITEQITERCPMWLTMGGKALRETDDFGTMV